MSRFIASRGATQHLEITAEIQAKVKRADGTVVDLGTITSPYNDRLRNYLWKKRKEAEIRRLLGRKK